MFFSSQIIPIVDGSVVLDAVRRVNVGGKLLTNLLKETLSFRQMNVQDCFHLVNKIKEAYSYLSLDVFRGRFARSLRCRLGELQNASHSLSESLRSPRLCDFLHGIRAGFHFSPFLNGRNLVRKSTPVSKCSSSRTSDLWFQKRCFILRISGFGSPESASARDRVCSRFRLECESCWLETSC